METINFLYTETRLSEVHLTCLKSFADKGHTCILWNYKSIENLPDFVQIEDAREIMLFDTSIPVRQFADIFRLQLLVKVGGWWSDLDNYCRLPLNFECKYVFAGFYNGTVNNNIIKAPAGSVVLQSFLDSNPDKYNFDALYKHIVSNGLKGSIFPVHFFNPLRINLTGELQSMSFVVHLYASNNSEENIIKLLQTL